MEEHRPASKPRSLVNTTIVIRLYGVDCPETAKRQSDTATGFSTSQPFGEEAKQLTKDLVYHQVVAIKLLKKDRYNRIVAEVNTLEKGPSKDISQELASKGLATMYTGKGVSEHSWECLPVIG